MSKYIVSARPRVATKFVCVLLSLFLVSSLAFSQQANHPPTIWLSEPQGLTVNHVSAAAASVRPGGLNSFQGNTASGPLQGIGQPISMASGDFDEDGVNDLVVGYSGPQGASIAVHRGNLDAFAPQSDASFWAISRGEFPSPFQSDALVIAVPVTPDFIAAGNFTGNGHTDIVIASRGGSVLYLLSGDGKGSFSAPQALTLPAGVTTLASGDFGHNTGPGTLLVGIAASPKSAILAVFRGTNQGLSYFAGLPLNGPASDIVFGNVDDEPDAVILAGEQVSILHSSTLLLEHTHLPVPAYAVAVGSFVIDRNPGLQIAVLGVDGTVHIAAHSEFDPRAYTPDETAALLRTGKLRSEPNPLLPGRAFAANGWKIVESISGAAPFTAGHPPVMFRTRISSNLFDDLVVLNSFTGELALISHPDVKPGATTFIPAQVVTRHYPGAAVHGIPLRVNIDGRAGIIALHDGQVAPSILMPLPDPTFTVNTTNDTLSAGACAAATPNQCSLREAIIEANNTAGTDTIMVPAGTYTLTIARNAADHHTSQTGTLEVQDSVNIIGGGQNTTIIQGGTNLTTSVDKVFSFNQDIDSFTNATVSISNLTIQNGHNRGDCCANQDGFGGAFDYDTGGNGTPGTGNANLTVTNLTIQNNQVFDGQGGGFTTFNTLNGTGFATVLNTIVQNNTSKPNATGCCGDGGGIVIDARSKIILDNVQVLNNQALSNAGTNATGGGLFLSGQHTQPQSQIHASTISGNTAAGKGGGLDTIATLLIDQDTHIINNTAGSDGSASNFGGGGLYNNSSDGLTLSRVTISGNTTTANGGGLATGNLSGGAPVTIALSRLAGNTGLSGSNNVYSVNSAVTATTTASPGTGPNWWGTNNPSSTIKNVNGGTTTFDPFIVLTHTANPSFVRINQSTTLTADFLHDNHASAVSANNLSELAGLPITFNNAILGTIPQAQPESIGANTKTIAASPTGATESGTTVTITTTAAHGFSAGQVVTISGVTDGRYNGIFTIAATPTTTTFTYANNNVAGGLPASGGGTATVPIGSATATFNAGGTSGMGHADATVDQQTVTVNIPVLEPVRIVKSFTPATVAVNAASTLTFSVTNPNVIAVDANFTDTFPTHVQVANPPAASNTCGGTFSPAAGNTSVTFTNASLAVGSCTITVNVIGTVDNVYSNSVTINSTAAGTGALSTSSANLTVINPPQITKTFTPTTIPFGATSSLSFTINSTNQNLTLNSITFTDTLPTNAPGTLVVANPNGVTNNCTGAVTAVAGSSSVSLASSSLAPGASCTVTVNVQGTKVGAANNSVNASDTTAGAGNTSSALETIIKADTSTTVTSSANPSVFGQSVTFTATVSPVAPGAGTPVGTVTFLDGGSPIGTGTLSGGVATFATSALTVGNHTITTNYGGDGNFNGSTGSLTGNPQVVNKANTSTTVTSSVNPSVFGQSVTFTATVSPVAPGAGTPVGTVTFLDGGSPIGTGTLSGGIATFTTSALTVGNHTITTNYGGDGNFNGSTGSLTGNPQVVNKANTSTTVTSSVNPLVFGQSVTFTATVSPVAPGSGTPVGTVTFLDGGSPIGTGTLSGGIATFTTSALTVGNHTITTNYGGDGNFNGSTGSLTGNPQVVNKANTTSTVTSSVNPAVFGQSVTFTATVSPVAPGSGTATGTVTFLDGGSPIGTGTLSGGIATFTTSALAIGNHTITTNYGGDGNFNGSTGSLTGNPQVVNKANTTTTVTSSANPSVFGQSVTFTATVSPVAPGSGTATGTVTFLDGGSPIGTGTLSGGIATFATSALTVGNHTITTNYGGDGNFNGSTGSLTGNPQVVNKADTSTTVTSSVNPSVFGQSVTFTATVSAVAPGSGTPTGTVTFLDGGSPIGTGTLSGGIATFSTSALTVGNHTITTNYGGDGHFNGSTGSLTGNPQVVNKANTATTVTSSVNPSVFGQSVTFTATVSPVAPGAGTPVGTVTFLDGGSPIGTGTLIGGVATFTTSALTPGNHTITTNYGGDGNFNGSTGSLTGNPQVVNKADTSTTVTSSQNPQTAGLPVTFTATVSAVAPGSGTPTGTVTFLDGGSPIGTGDLSGGVATFTTSSLSPGSHTITTSYGGDANFNGSTGSLTGNPQVITQATTTTTVTSSAGTITLGDTVTFTATVTASSGTAPGLVTFFDGNTPLGSGTLAVVGGNDQATFTTSLLSASGSPHSIKATYQGATAFAASTSSPISETVNPRTSTTGVVLNPTTVVVGQSSTATVTVTDSGSVPPGTADTFAPTGAPATGRTGFTSTLFADGLVLVAGGTDANNNVLNSAEIYSVSNGTFSSTGNLNTARTGAVAVLLPNGKVLVAGGSSDGTANGALNTAELFDPNAGTFAVAGSGSSNQMTAARLGASATLLNTGKVLIAGGVNSGGVLNSAELYDPATDKFTATGNLNAARTGASATLLGTGKVLVAGGSSDGTANGALNSAEVFDPAGNAGAGTFTSVAGANPTLGANRWQPEAALLLSGKVLIAGGQNSGGALTSADVYDPVADSFTASSQQMSQARANGSAVSLPSGMVLLAGGTTSQAVELYDGDSDKFNTTGSLQQSDAGLVSTLLNNGQVLVVGLTTAVTPASDAELYSPSFNPLGTVAVTSSEVTDNITGACTLTPSNSTASTCTSTVTPTNVATSPHTITGTYPADAVHSGSNNTASLTVNKADTTTTLTSSVNPSVFGQSVTFTATVSPVAPGSGTPTGTVTFLDGGSPIGTGTLSGGIATFTTSALAVGNHTITSHYGGDANFNGNNGSLTGNPQVVNKADTSTTVTSSVNPSVFGQSVTFTATVSAVAPGSGTPTGTVTLLDGGNPIGTGTLSGGIATFTTSALAVGNHTITTSYGGDGNFNGNTGSLTGNPQVVNKADTSTTVTSSLNPSVFGQSVTFTATVSAVAPGSGTPTGIVTFLDGGSPIGTGTLSGGIATFTTSALATGNHTITTSYGGDGNFNGSTGSLTGNPQVVNKADTTTTVTSSVNPSVFGQAVTFTATVSAVAPGAGTPTGTVTFLDGGSPIGTGTLSGGIATFTTSALAVGNHTITTSYGGDGNFNGSTGSLTGNPQVVNKADTTTTVTSSANPSVFGQSVTFTATVSPVAPGSGTPTGTVTFLDGGSPIGTGTLSGGIATFTTSALAVGNHTITTSYGGDGNFNGSTGSLTGNPQVVNKADTSTTVTSSVNPSVFGQSVTFTATVSAVAPGSGTPTGTVTFLDGGSPIGTGTLSGGIATFTTSALAVGNHTITTSYGGDGNFNGSTGSLTGNPQVVNKADTATTVTSSLNPSVFGQPVTFTATVSAVAPGSGTPTGTVTFLDGGSPIGTGTLSGGVATFTTSALAAGNHTITTSYGGDGNFNGSTGSLTGNPQVVNKANATMTVTSSLNPSVFGQPVTFTATVSAVPPGAGTPTGTVTFLDGGSPIGTGTLSGGVATFTTAALATGSHTITTSYGGDGNFNGSTGSLTGNPQVVNKANTSQTVTSSANPAAVGQAVTFTATVSAVPPGAGTPTGTVTFLDGGNPIGTGTLSGGVATFTTSSLASGSHTITTTYGGDGNFNGSTGSLTGNPEVIASPPTITKNFGASSILLNATTSLSFSISNPNTGLALTGVAFTDALPAGLVVGTPNGLSSTCGGTVTATAGSSSVSLSGGTLAANGSCAISLTVKGVQAGVQNNTTGPISSTQSGAGATSNTASITVIGPPNIAKAFGAHSINLGATTTLTFTITNPNATVGLTGVGFGDTLPAGLTIPNPNGLTGSCGSGTITTGTVSGFFVVNLSGGTIAAGGSCTFAINVVGQTGGHKVNTTGTVTSSNAGSGNQATDFVDVQAPDPTIAKTHTGNFQRGQTGAQYTITVSNVGFGNTQGTVTVTDTLPNVQNTLVPTAMSGTGWTCNLGTLTCTRSDALPAGSSYPPITLTVDVPKNIQANVTNTATVSGGGDVNPNNNTATDPTHIGPPLQIEPANASTLNIAAGGIGSLNFQVDSSANLGFISFGCSGLPAGALCSFNPQAENALTSQVTMTITTLGKGHAGAQPFGFGNTPPPFYAAVLLPLFGLLAMLMKGRSRRLKLRLAFCAVALVALLALAGCGGTAVPLITPQGSFTVVVSANDAVGDQATTTITVNVQ